MSGKQAITAEGVREAVPAVKWRLEVCVERYKWRSLYENWH